ncbi:hypothetical protein AB0B50_32385 [Streptomyces sp. NPDC041068]|uniref:hypothetical protein n=1 Tax=Streptomyces sp. NPDC041068 TaxID=3155130 RepID=UPI0033DDA38A
MTTLRSAFRTVVADALRALWSHLWPAPLSERPRNRRYLRERMIALPLLAVVAAASFGWAYAQVRGDSAALRDSFGPALGDLADAEMSLRIADREAEESLRAGEAVQLSGLSKRYRTRTTRATQSLNQVARSGALTTAERQELDVVSGLVADYGTWISFAQNNVGDTALRNAGLSYARSMLCSTPGPAKKDDKDGYPPCEAAAGSASDATAVVDRISTLESRLRGRLADRAALGGGVIAASAVAAVALALLVSGLWRTQFFVHHRLHLRVSVPLLIAALPLLAVPFLTADAVLAHRAQQRVVTTAGDLTGRTSPGIESTVDEEPFGPRNPLLISALEEDITTDLDAGRLSSLDGVTPWVAPVGVLAAALMGATLHGYRREYVLISRSGAAV